MFTLNVSGHILLEMGFAVGQVICFFKDIYEPDLLNLTYVIRFHYLLPLLA